MGEGCVEYQTLVSKETDLDYRIATELVCELVSFISVQSLQILGGKKSVCVVSNLHIRKCCLCVMHYTPQSSLIIDL